MIHLARQERFLCLDVIAVLLEICTVIVRTLLHVHFVVVVVVFSRSFLIRMNPKPRVIVQRVLAHLEPRFVLDSTIQPLFEVQEQRVNARALEGSPVDVAFVLLFELAEGLLASHLPRLFVPLESGLGTEVGVVHKEDAAELGKKVPRSPELHDPRHLVLAITRKPLLKRRQIATISEGQIRLVPIALDARQIHKRPQLLIPPRNVLRRPMSPRIRRIERARLLPLNQTEQRTLAFGHRGDILILTILVLLTAPIHLEDGDDRGELRIGGESRLDVATHEGGVQIGRGPKVDVRVDNVGRLHGRECDVPQQIHGILRPRGIVLGRAHRLDRDVLLGTSLQYHLALYVLGRSVGEDDDAHGIMSPSLAVMLYHPHPIF
mmetsp:Transcript_28375/g.51827  ORF Transcript_28375/g.51827 Transcript_28375/m.51827 type:complete len:377 (+) Transcript_28375:612-1742(+)